MIRLADERLGRNGRLTAAASALYARRLARQPVIAEAMVKLDRARELELARSGGEVGGG